MEIGCDYRAALRRGACFNEATAFRPWKCVKIRRLSSCQRLASMRPRPFGRGNRPEEDQHTYWPCASMRPRPFGRGNQPRNVALGLAGEVASMRPRPFGRGNRPLHQPSNHAGCGGRLRALRAREAKSTVHGPFDGSRHRIFSLIFKELHLCERSPGFDAPLERSQTLGGEGAHVKG